MSNKFLIGEVAKYLDISRDTLRYYDKENILKPSKIGDNGYRYYTFEDIIKLMYIITFRCVGMSIKEIKDMIANCTLEELEALMVEKEIEIDKRIKDLKRLKKTVSHFRDDIKRTIRLLNIIEIVESPYMLYEGINASMNFALYKRMKALENINGIHSVTFSNCIKSEYFYSGNLEENTLYSISGICEECNYERLNKSYNIYKYNKCIHSIIKVEIDIVDENFDYIREYIKENNIEVYGNSMARFITFESKNVKSYDYVEVWIPIK